MIQRQGRSRQDALAQDVPGQKIFTCLAYWVSCVFLSICTVQVICTHSNTLTVMISLTFVLYREMLIDRVELRVMTGDEQHQG